MLTRARAVVLAVAALALAACNNVHPGDAAVVDGESISMGTFTRTAEAYCALTLGSAQLQGITTVSNSDVRRQAVLGLVSVVVARDLAESENLEIARSAYELTGVQREQLAVGFPDADLDEVEQAIEDAQEVSAIAVALASKQTGQPVTEQTRPALEEAGRAAVAAAFEGFDVSFAPRFGLSPSGEARSDTGSLSVAPVDLEAPAVEDLPVAQRCS